MTNENRSMRIDDLFSQTAGIGGHHTPRNRTDTWLTPPYILDALGGADSFDLDPCAPVSRPWDTARRHFTERENGLVRGWNGRVWLNPPYHRATIAKWLARMAAHGHGIALIFARTETAHFARFVWPVCNALFFIEGRLTFHLPDDRSTALGRTGRIHGRGTGCGRSCL